jgi:hypothetical protein
MGLFDDLAHAAGQAVAAVGDAIQTVATKVADEAETLSDAATTVVNGVVDGGHELVDKNLGEGPLGRSRMGLWMPLAWRMRV